MLGFARFKTQTPVATPDPALRIDELRSDKKRELMAAIRAYCPAQPDGPLLAITCAGRYDGAGAQALGVLSAMLWARGLGIPYLHMPFATVDHAIGSRIAWAERWEHFLNLGHGEAPVPPDATLVSVAEFLRDPESSVRPGMVLAAPAYHWKPFQTPQALQGMRSSLHAKYYSSRKSGITLHRGSPGTLMVAIHVRRGDITLDHPQRTHLYTHDEPVLKTIEYVRAVADSLGHRVHINLFSEGPPEMFRAFAAADCRLHLDGDAFEAFHNLVSADILIQAKSSFSYMAGLISTGAVLHERYVSRGGGTFYRPAPGWVVRDETGAFDAEELRKLLASGPWRRRARRWLGW